MSMRQDSQNRFIIARLRVSNILIKFISQKKKKRKVKFIFYH